MVGRQEGRGRVWPRKKKSRGRGGDKACCAGQWRALAGKDDDFTSTSLSEMSVADDGRLHPDVGWWQLHAKGIALQLALARYNGSANWVCNLQYPSKGLDEQRKQGVPSFIVFHRLPMMSAHFWVWQVTTSYLLCVLFTIWRLFYYQYIVPRVCVCHSLTFLCIDMCECTSYRNNFLLFLTYLFG